MMVKHLFFFSFLFLVSIPDQLFAQGSKAKISAVGTGQTTGHIADLTITNDSDEPLTVDLDMIYIPSDGKHQGYIVIGGGTITVPPNSTVTVPLNGYCADIHLPPVPKGEAMVPFGDWITPANAGPSPEPGFVPGEGSPFEPVNTDQGTTYTVTYPGTDEPFPYTIDFNAHPSEAAPIIFDAIEHITKTVEDMYENGTVPPTPFTNNPVKEKEALIQQTFWVYTSSLKPNDDGPNYTVDDFSDRTVEQFENTTGVDFESVPEAVQEQVNQGVLDFWSSFEAVGIEAKVIKKNAPESTPPTIEVICPKPGDYVSLEGFEISWEVQDANGNTLEHSQPYTIDIQPYLQKDNSGLNVEGVIDNEFDVNGLTEGNCYNISITSNFNGLNIGNIPFAICLDNITLDSLIKLVNEMGEKVNDASAELEGNSLVKEARLIQMITELLSTPDKLWDVLNKWLNTEIEKLKADLTSIDDIGEVIETVELIEKLLDNLIKIDPKNADAYKRIKKKCEDLRKHWLEPGKDAQEKFNQLYDELTAMLTDFKGYLGDKAEDYLREKIERTLRNMLIAKFGEKAAGAMISAAIDMASFIDALIKKGNLDEAKVMYHLMFFEMMKRTYEIPKWKIDGNYNDKADPPRIVWSDCDEVNGKKVTMRAYVVCWEQKEGSETPGEGKFSEGKPIRFKQGEASPYEIEKENFSTDCEGECAFKYKLDMDDIARVAGNCPKAYIYIEAKVGDKTYPRVYVGTYKP